MNRWIAFGVALVAAQLFGEFPPLSRFTMYADLDATRKPAILSLRSDGKPIQVSDYQRFSGAILTLPWPEDVPCSMRWYRDELRAQLLRDTSEEPGPVPLEWGYYRVAWIDGAVKETGDFVVLAHGTAWPR